jgi:hypothetical protein
MLSVHGNGRRENKNGNSAIKILPGFISRVSVRCGKAHCRCRFGARHTAFYRVTYSRGLRVREYVRRNEVDAVRAACDAHRELQTQLRAGRAKYKESLARTRNLIKLLASESESKGKTI